MTISEEIKKERERIISALHASVGLCGHCGKKTCAGKKGGSFLPQKIYAGDVLNAIEDRVIP